MKKLLFILFLLPLFSSAQFIKGQQVNGAPDSAYLLLSGPNNGKSVWHDYDSLLLAKLGEWNIGTFTASNGLTKIGDEVQLGGTLTAPTAIDIGENTFDIYGDGGSALSMTSSDLALYFSKNSRESYLVISEDLIEFVSVDFNTSLASRIFAKSDSLLLSSGRNGSDIFLSQISLFEDKIIMRPFDGNLFIDSLNENSAATKYLVWGSGGKVGWKTGTGGTADGNGIYSADGGWTGYRTIDVDEGVLFQSASGASFELSGSIFTYTFGNASITGDGDKAEIRHGFFGVTAKSTGVEISGIPTYADDAAAGAGGLTAGTLYKTSTGVLMIKL